MSSAEINSAIATARKIYVDSNVIIYLIEGGDESQRLAERLFEHAEEQSIELVTSEITVGECLYGAYKRARADSVDRFESFFEDVGFLHLVPVMRETLKEAARFGATRGMKLVDAIHAASAIEAGCDAFVTNDRGIKSAGALLVVQLPDLSRRSG